MEHNGSLWRAGLQALSSEKRKTRCNCYITCRYQTAALSPGLPSLKWVTLLMSSVPTPSWSLHTVCHCFLSFLAQAEAGRKALETIPFTCKTWTPYMIWQHFHLWYHSLFLGSLTKWSQLQTLHRYWLAVKSSQSPTSIPILCCYSGCIIIKHIPPMYVPFHPLQNMVIKVT